MITIEAAKYSPQYFETRHYGDDPARACMYAMERARVQAYIPGGKIFDVGCGVGDFLAGFDPARYERYGIDISAYATEQARARGIQALDYCESLPYPDGSFDGVLMRGTFQHFWNPFHTLRESVRILKPGGYLIFLATPNTRSLCYFLFGELPALDPHRNWYVVSDNTLQVILRNLGFEILAVEYPYLKTPYCNPARDMFYFMLRFFGIKKNHAFPRNMMEVFARKL